jgi:hypothetical protein
MSSKKYVLNPDGSVTRKSVDEIGRSIVESISPNRASNDQMLGFDNFESLRTSGNFKSLPFKSGIKDRIVVSYDDNLKLYDSSFGSKEDYIANNQYYNQFNSMFSDEKRNKKVFAEELEMLAGFDVNSIGVLDLNMSVDLIKFSFILDYVLESVLYVVIAELIMSYPGENVFYSYFYDVLNYPKFSKDKLKFEPLAYFLIGLNEFINTDPKFDELIKNKILKKANLNISSIDYKSPNVLWTMLLNNLADNLFSLSKLEHNRIGLLIRKFQKESYWHKELLYRAKEDSIENWVDKLFVEFSQYYFKFIIERMHIGRMIWRRKVNIAIQKDKKINFSNRLGEDRQRASQSKIIQTLDNKNEKRNRKKEIVGDLYSKYLWKEEDSRNPGNNTFSITALPQLLKTNTYIKKVALQNRKLKQNFDDSDEGRLNVEQKRLSPEIQKLVEDHLDNEYMPFYFHDLRTNEILAFHAFIDTISDSFSPEYTSSTGYGRIDDVKHYVKTTRSINTTFSLVSYNQDDHDLMWYQINKLVSMVYPQWSKGIRIKNTAHAYPFTQMPTASPLIRLRIGDVITSNYSKENLARLHSAGRKGGVGRQKVSSIDNKKTRQESQTNTPRKILKDYFEASLKIKDNAYAMPVFYPGSDRSKLGESRRDNEDKYFDKKPISKEEYNNLSSENKKKFVAPRMISNKNDSGFVDFQYFTDMDNELHIFHTEHRVNVVESVDSNCFVAERVDDTGKAISKKFYVVKGENIKITKSKEYRNAAGKIVVDAKRNGRINNPFTAAYESSRGEGLAGFITNLDVNYNESTWQTEIKGSRAPMMVKITISFAPVHDIPPGLDHLGEMRAPVYNVGSINRKMFRTPYDDIDANEIREKESLSILDQLNKPIKPTSKSSTSDLSGVDIFKK